MRAKSGRGDCAAISRSGASFPRKMKPVSARLRRLRTLPQSIWTRNQNGRPLALVTVATHTDGPLHPWKVKNLLYDQRPVAQRISQGCEGSLPTLSAIPSRNTYSQSRSPGPICHEDPNCRSNRRVHTRYDRCKWPRKTDFEQCPCLLYSYRTEPEAVIRRPHLHGRPIRASVSRPD